LSSGRHSAHLLVELGQKLLRARVAGVDPQHLVKRPLVLGLVGSDRGQPQPRDLVIRLGLEKLPEHLARFDALARLGKLNGLVK
jgi:hypothetical protein